MDIHAAVDTLNKLIETCKDGEYGFRTSADHVKSAQLRTILFECSESCRQGATELQAEVVWLGAKPEHHSSMAGTLHRGWVSLKATLTGNDDQAILEECERAEDAALARYREAIGKALPSDVAAIVERQYEGAKRNHDKVRSLRDSLRSSA